MRRVCERPSRFGPFLPRGILVWGRMNAETRQDSRAAEVGVYQWAREAAKGPTRQSGTERRQSRGPTPRRLPTAKGLDTRRESKASVRAMTRTASPIVQRWHSRTRLLPRRHDHLTIPRRLMRPVSTRPARRAVAIGFGATLLAGLAIAVATSVAIGAAAAGTVLPGITVGGVELSGLDRAAATQRLTDELPSLSTGQATIVVGDGREVVAYADARAQVRNLGHGRRRARDRSRRKPLRRWPRAASQPCPPRLAPARRACLRRGCHRRDRRRDRRAVQHESPSTQPSWPMAPHSR